MKGIDLNSPIQYKHSSMRYFEEGEHHVNRVCDLDVLLLVFDGLLRFSEDGIEYEIGPGEYHIQKHGSRQLGTYASDMPKYLYIHFLGQWADTGSFLPFRGTYDYPLLKPLMEKLDALAHGDFTAVEQCAVFMEILSRLYRSEKADTAAGQMARFMAEHLRESLSLERLCEEFHFSKNHIINLFKQEFGTTPTEYLNTLRLQRAKHLLEATSAAAEAIATDCGYNSYSHFYRLFIRENNIPPTRWREQKRLSP